MGILENFWIKRANTQPKQFKYEILKTPEQKMRGLQFRASLDPNTVLVFEDVTEGTFHSENCKFPFAIGFLDSNNQLIKKAIMYPQEDLCNVPRGTVRVVEAVPNFFDRFSIGDKVEILHG